MENRSSTSLSVLGCHTSSRMKISLQSSNAEDAAHACTSSRLFRSRQLTQRSGSVIRQVSCRSFRSQQRTMGSSTGREGFSRSGLSPRRGIGVSSEVRLTRGDAIGTMLIDSEEDRRGLRAGFLLYATGFLDAARCYGVDISVLAYLKNPDELGLHATRARQRPATLHRAHEASLRHANMERSHS
ncbi:hypothetical protein GQ43DRAFT_123860 [Delitschia confertaspora ATCC 74209]|uniref:Uncharacterized protein n=1 Tax=Delitschia confertaspora ATCC 74209 TaxID=1513339 RepID=A0A9P4MQE3_9PLEO|nr:hypothetical protein GQ43DRAFT_123860 [Delitschia confertaspora ATCC 74209]